MNRLLKLYEQYNEVILYLFFGVLTTVVSISTYFLFSEIWGIHYLISNVLSWIFSVLFAYATNRTWVFNSKNEGLRLIIQEMFTFINCRLLSGAIEMLIMFIFVSILSISSINSKIFVQIIVVILNYIFSKLIIFKNKN